MNIEIYPDPIKKSSRWRRFEGAVAEPVDSSALTFLYVGQDREFTGIFSRIFRSGFTTETLSESLTLFKDLPRNQYPDVMILDLQTDKKALKDFHSFLQTKKIANRIIIIYNEKQLTTANINYLKDNELVDDVIDMETSVENLTRKINFLKKIKQSQPKPNRITSEQVAKVISRQSRTPLMKRLIDITFASIILLAILPVLVIIAIAIRIDSKGPIIYSSLRAGKGFRIFKFYKFRTMVVDADKKMEQFAHLNQYSNEDGSEAKFVKIANDPRITRLGKILRNCSLDELPQLFNVIKGDMSLVGNRPLPLYEAATLTTDAHVERFMAPAGITGLWQIKKRGNAEMSVEERINLDISYARRYNVVYDLWIVANTPAALFQKTNV